ncbi:MAG: type IX secretion system sortase PorU [Bacteroidetes bacterium]|nr:type IX secretion system sortase PorU [Bacteroidota bacterium]
MKPIYLTSITAYLISLTTFANFTKNYDLKWGAPKTEQVGASDKIQILSFDGASYSSELLPMLIETIDLPSSTNSFTVQISDIKTEALSEEEQKLLPKTSVIGTQVSTLYSLEYERKQPKAVISIIPLQKNESTGRINKVVHFKLDIIPVSNGSQKKLSFTYAANSVLAQGDWFKIGVTNDGVYKLSYTFLKSLGIPVDSINPKHLQLYGNGGKMLSYNNSVFRYDDLQENAIELAGEADFKFDSTDYILFYGQGTTRWNYSAADHQFHHELNFYSDTNYYFLTYNANNGKRIQLQLSDNNPATHTITSFDDYAFHEQESVNFIKTGRNWYGENFGIVTNYSFPFNFPNIDLTKNVYLKADVMGQSAPSSTFSITCQNGALDLTPPAVNTSCYYCDYALPANGSISFQPNSANLTVDVNFSKSPGAISASGWLNYIELNARRYLAMTGNQLLFRDASSYGIGNIGEFFVSNITSTDKIWDVTDLTNVKLQVVNYNGTTGNFKLATDQLREFIAFTNSGYLTPHSVGRISNQNLHNFIGADMIIISHPLFLNEAQRLADFHKIHDTLSAVVVTPQEIYNEFSSGKQDISALKHFTKMFYDRATTASELPRYLLLFGDGSYDNKTRNTSTNSNFIPTYQSDNSTDPTKSYVTDDFYGLLDDTEGDGLAQLMDIGVGRFPAKTVSEAQAMVNKVINYETKTPLVIDGSNASINGDWKNVVCFVADDQDGNTHVSDAETISTFVDTNYRNINIDKIYFDAFKQMSTAGGQRYPDVTAAINQRIDNGALIMNYTGHGGETGWAHERVIDISTINDWGNVKKLPLFVTATCEFSRYDDPARTSAGEDVLLNPNGGGIGLLTTTRLVYSNPNFVLNYNFYKNAFKPIAGGMPRLGDIAKVTKNSSVSSASTNHRNFTLLGDPALKLAYPKESVVTSTLNTQSISVNADTVKALSKITITGYIQDINGAKMSSFNGLIYPTVFDKSKIVTTQGNDSDSPKKNFRLQKSIVYKGKVSVINGDFSFTFVVPKDIALNFGKGRLSYYADNGETDASGNNENFIIGGVSSAINSDNEGPQVQLYLNNDKFINGGITNENPVLYAKVQDDNGINTVGNGIGHDIVSMLDLSSDKTYVLNDYYQAELDSYQKGTIRYQLSNLAEGKHDLSLKVWDTYNNSSVARTEFVVSKSARLALQRIFNYPNPFTTSTNFYFQHNQADNGMNVQIQIFTVSGKLIKTIEQFVRTEGFTSESIHWDGLDDFGDKIGKGVYVYRLKAIDSTGGIADKFEKLVILN